MFSPLLSFLLLVIKYTTTAFVFKFAIVSWLCHKLCSRAEIVNKNEDWFKSVSIKKNKKNPQFKWALTFSKPNIPFSIQLFLLLTHHEKKERKRFTLDGNPACGMYADSNSLYSIKSLGFASWSVANSVCGKLSSEITQIPQKEVLFWPTGALGAVVNYWFRYIR